MTLSSFAIQVPSLIDVSLKPEKQPEQHFYTTKKILIFWYLINFSYSPTSLRFR